MTRQGQRFDDATGTTVYTTVTVVVLGCRPSDDDPDTMLDRITRENTLFLSAEEGVTRHARDLGADPSSWPQDDDEKPEKELAIEWTETLNHEATLHASTVKDWLASLGHEVAEEDAVDTFIELFRDSPQLVKMLANPPEGGRCHRERTVDLMAAMEVAK